MSWRQRLERVLLRRQELADRMATGGATPEVLTRLAKEYAETSVLAAALGPWRAALRELEDLEAVQADPTTDPEVRALAAAERRDLQARLPALEQAARVALLPRDDADARNVILEIRAGTGGDEASLFAADLLRMYQRYALRRGWRVAMIDESPTPLGGCAQAVASIAGDGVYGRLKFESGVHRVQRVPVTESGGRIHTSAATVAVLPEAEEVEVDIRTEELRIDTYRSQGAGGQHVNTTDSAVRITHLPTGLVVQCQDEKSQHKNRARALMVLRARLRDQEQRRQEQDRASARRALVGGGDRSERIRTYNFPQGRITDHRIGLTSYGLLRVLEGEGLDEFLDALAVEDRTLRLAVAEEA